MLYTNEMEGTKGTEKDEKGAKRKEEGKRCLNHASP